VVRRHKDIKKISFIILARLVLAISCIFAGDNAVAESPVISSHYNIGQWLPSDQLFFDQWLEALVEGKESAVIYVVQPDV
jgi:hypothetical protein